MVVYYKDACGTIRNELKKTTPLRGKWFINLIAISLNTWAILSKSTNLFQRIYKFM